MNHKWIAPHLFIKVRDKEVPIQELPDQSE